MPRYRLDIEYDGSAYAGWQRQAGQHSVQAAIEQAVKGFCGEDVTIRGAGRTDAGVHATGQVAHVDLARDWPADTVRDAVNAHLQMAGETVSVLAASIAADDFDARFSAVGRHYLYRIVNRRSPLALEAKKAWWVAQRRSMPRRCMRPRKRWSAGTTSPPSGRCNARRRARSRRSTGSTSTRNGEAIEIRASARSFLHNQVRSMVGSLKRVGEGAWSAADLAAALEARDRAACGPVAPPDGLYLDEGRLPERLIRSAGSPTMNCSP